MKKTKPFVFLLLSLMLLSGETVFGQKTASKPARKSVRTKAVTADKTVQNKGKVKAPAFVIEDQFSKKFSFKFPAKKVTVFIFGDRKGSEQIEGWVRPLYEKYTDKIEIHGIAELSAVPWIAKGFVRNSIKSKSKTPIMLDWSGKISKDYGSESEKANLFVVSKEGYIIAEKRGAATALELEDLQKIISTVLE